MNKGDARVTEVYKCPDGHFYNKNFSVSCPYCDFQLPEIPIPKKEARLLYGWLVCVAAEPDQVMQLKGRDYRIKQEENRIGGNPNECEVVIKGDPHIKPADPHRATITCTTDKNVTQVWLQPVMGFNVFYGHKILTEPVLLDNHRVSETIKIGNGIYIYMPFVGAQAGLKFNWYDEGVTPHG